MKFEGLRRLNLGCVGIHLTRRRKRHKHWENVKFLVDLIQSIDIDRECMKPILAQQEEDQRQSD